MFDPQMQLLMTVLDDAVRGSSSEGGSWADAKAALAACGEVAGEDADVAEAVASEDSEAVRALLDAWRSGERHLVEHDRDVLKRAMKAFRKSLKVTLLDAESSLGGGAFSSGRHSSIVGIRPPERYGAPVWDELVRQGRLTDEGPGLYGLPPE